MAKEQAQLVELLDEGFDDLAYGCDSTPVLPRAPRAMGATPHCDCRGANELAGRKLKRRVSVDDQFEMVPTRTLSARPDHCIFCGHHVYMRTPAGAYAPDSATRFERDLAKRHYGHKVVVGRSLATGDEVVFPSALHAKRAGFGSVPHALMSGKPLKGYIWRRAS